MPAPPNHVRADFEQCGWLARETKLVNIYLLNNSTFTSLVTLSLLLEPFHLPITISVETYDLDTSAQYAARLWVGQIRRASPRINFLAFPLNTHGDFPITTSRRLFHGPAVGGS